MATYVIGDVHGCFRTLRALLERIEWNPHRDRLIFTGDLVNGPDSLAVLRWARDHNVETVLGNHDIHLMAVVHGIRGIRKSDSLDDLLAAPDREELVDWLRTRPMLIRLETAAVVHAGLLPQWTLEKAQELARELETELGGERVPDVLPGLFGNKPKTWSDTLAGDQRLRIVVNAMTRMRVVKADGRLDMKFKGSPRKVVDGQLPLFEVPSARSADVELFFGHWAALGYYEGNGVVGLDTGCVWGKALTAFRLEDRAVFQEKSERA